MDWLCAVISVGILWINCVSRRSQKSEWRTPPATRHSEPALRRALCAHRIDLFVGRKPAGLLLRESEPAIDGDLEHPTYPGYQLDIGAVFLDEPIPRTEGTRFVVSGLAPLDADFHCHSSGRDDAAYFTTRVRRLP